VKHERAALSRVLIPKKTTRKDDTLPLLKIYVDEAMGPEQTDRLAAALPALRELVCRELKVDASICQFSIITVRGLSDQAQLTVEIQLLPKSERSRDLLLDVCGRVREALLEATQERAAIRVNTVDPVTYITMR